MQEYIRFGVKNAGFGCKKLHMSNYFCIFSGFKVVPKMGQKRMMSCRKDATKVDDVKLAMCKSVTR